MPLLTRGGAVRPARRRPPPPSSFSPPPPRQGRAQPRDRARRCRRAACARALRGGSAQPAPTHAPPRTPAAPPARVPAPAPAPRPLAAKRRSRRSAAGAPGSRQRASAACRGR
eukprot:42564-Rhodomonas_salina.1